MITDLWIENFKGIGKRQHIPLKPITMLFGKNSAGKSTVLLSLLYLREILEHRDCNPEVATRDETIEFGGFENLCHVDERGFRTNAIRIECRVIRADGVQGEDIDKNQDLLERRDKIAELMERIRSTTVQFKISQKVGEPVVVSSSEIQINDQLLCRISGDSAGARVQINHRHPLLWTRELGWLNRVFERIVIYGGEYLEYSGASDSQRIHEFLHQFGLPSLIPVSESLTIDEGKILLSIPKAGVIAVVPTIMLYAFLYDPLASDEEDDDDDDFDAAELDELRREYSDKALFIFDESTGMWTTWGLFASSSDGERTANSEVSQQLELLEEWGPILNSVETRGLQNCWQSIPDPRKQALVTRSLRDDFFKHPLLASIRLHSVPDLEDQGRFCDILLRTPIVSIIESVTEMVHIGPKRRDVPRGLSTQTVWGLTSWRDGSAAWKHLLRKGDPVLDRVSDWLSGIHYLNSGYALEIDMAMTLASTTLMKLRKRIAESAHVADALSELDAIANELTACQVLRLRADKRTLHFRDVGEGITQVVPILVALAAFHALITVEQPELHLHPAMQGALGDVFLNSLSQNLQGRVLIETHSEHLILRLLRRIRQTTDGGLPEHIPPVKPDDVCVLWVDNLGDGTIFKRLEINKFGDFIDRWPRGFFTERSEELY